MGENAESNDARRRIYGLISRNPGWTLEEMAAEVGCSRAEAEEMCDELGLLGLLTPASASPSGYVTVTPEVALTRLFSAEERQTTAHLQLVSRIRTAISTLVCDLPLLSEERREVVDVQTLPTPAVVNAFLEQAGSAARVRMRSMHPGGPPPEELIDEMLLRDKEMEGRGIRVDALYPRRTAEVPYMAAYLADAVRPGREARIAEYLPLRMILFDDDRAVLPVNPADSSEGAYAIHGRSLVASLHALYDYCWRNAAPSPSVLARAGEHVTLDGQDLVVVRMLADGVKDEAIARHLGISSRTLSRTISALMERLGVQTRFQAALRIAELGLMD
ncbi:helix-turn-helix transcriptional regulator [Streptomyces sp. WMMC940]|uniref:helix-turn-helix transcriptional regulator n=1 Tax=Streptomyces sp. WMMC940 TaxID=3015153 RepID=UPI0022B754B3|nr:helix-turn-helix transcriptional regulator [Streptomyces sp. WMMC940]MCZ7456183.1 helix-turn-helix transcriptional regulator [Streptomyces sp. WMMC940]